MIPLKRQLISPRSDQHLHLVRDHNNSAMLPFELLIPHHELVAIISTVTTTGVLWVALPYFVFVIEHDAEREDVTPPNKAFDPLVPVRSVGTYIEVELL